MQGLCGCWVTYPARGGGNKLHKERNVCDLLPERDRDAVCARIRATWSLTNPELAEQRLELLAGELDRSWPDAAGSLREGMQDTLTLMRLGITGNLAQTLCSTNPCESMIEIVRNTQRNMKRWQESDMRKRWTATGTLVAERSNGASYTPPRASTGRRPPNSSLSDRQSGSPPKFQDDPDILRHEEEGVSWVIRIVISTIRQQRRGDHGRRTPRPRPPHPPRPHRRHAARTHRTDQPQSSPHDPPTTTTSPVTVSVRCLTDVDVTPACQPV